MVEIELPDGTILEAPDGANVKAVVQGYNRRKAGAGVPGAAAGTSATPPLVGAPTGPPAQDLGSTIPAYTGSPDAPPLNPGKQSFADRSAQFNDQMRSAIVRPLVKGVAAVPGIFADATMAGINLATGSNYQMPSAALDAELDRFTRKPEGVGKVAEIISSALVGGAATPTSLLTGSAAQAARTPAQVAGYIQPGATGGVTRSLAQGIAGKKSLEQGAAVANQRTTNALARRAVGLADDAEITIPALRSIREAAGNTYAQVARTGSVVPDEQFLDDLAQLDEGAIAVLRDFPDAAPAASAEVRRIVTSLLRDRFNARSALEYLKELRANAAGNLKFQNAADPAKRTLGMAQREAAHALEELMERHLAQTGQQALAREFQQARAMIARTYAVQSALNESTGNVVATALGGQLKRGKHLTGELETIARFARSFPKAAREVTETFPGVSPWDFALSSTAALATGSVLPALYPVARVAARRALLSRYGQGSSVISPRALGGTMAGVEDAAR